MSYTITTIKESFLSQLDKLRRVGEFKNALIAHSQQVLKLAGVDHV